jgi:hypothetical protein
MAPLEQACSWGMGWGFETCHQARQIVSPLMAAHP